MGLRRWQDWPARLEEYFKGAAERPFSWAEWNCGFFAAGAVEAMTGEDFVAEFRGAFDDEKGAIITLRPHGGFVGLVNDALGAKLPTVMKAQRGDIVLADNEVGGMLGVVDLTGRNFLAVTERDGLRTFPLSKAVSAWRV